MYDAIPEQSTNIMMDIINKAIHLVTVMYMAVCIKKDANKILIFSYANDFFGFRETYGAYYRNIWKQYLFSAF